MPPSSLLRNILAPCAMVTSDAIAGLLTPIRRTPVARDPTPKPWEDWQLDAAFLSAIQAWNISNPQSTLARILESASLAIDQGKDLVEVIPDTPFPAKGLVKALFQLIKLGANISLAHLKLLEFANDIVTWVDGVASSFSSASGGEFTKNAWESLAKVRELIDEICTWATLRLADGRWSFNNLKVNNEIADFKSRLNDARQIFRDRSIIGLSGGFDSTLRKLGTVLGYQDKITRTLGKLKKTQDDHYRRLMDELHGQKETQARRQFLQTFLNPYTAERLAYNQQEKMPCDEGTRVEVLAEIRQWVNDVSSSSRNFLWLTGDPGCGKSAVTASVARECKDNKTLWAQFFINRNIKDTTNPNLYFPSIARQLADYSDVVERQVHFALVQQPSIMDEISSTQATKLFVDTLAAAASIDSKKPVVVVIDGLDETQREHLESTATIFSHLFDALAKYRNAKVFISSRTEDGIQKPFSMAMKDKRVKNLHLYTNAESSIRDVTTYLRRRIAQTAIQHRLDPTLWPGEERLATLAFHAAGHFIWAVTVTRFLHEQMEEWGHECLDTVMLNLGTTDGKQDIKVLYGLILQLSYQKSKDPWAFETFRRVVGAVATALEPLSINLLEGLLNLRRDSASPRVDLNHFVRRLRTVLVAGTDDITKESILRLHKSFFEYVTSDSCEERFRVSLEASNAELAVQCLQEIADAYRGVRQQFYALTTFKTMGLSAPLRYALRFCASHFPDRTKVGVVTDDMTITISQLDTLIHPSSSSIVTHGGPITFRHPPNAKHISCSVDAYAFFWNATSGQITTPRPWPTAEIPSGEDGVRGRIECLAIMPDGMKIATGCSYKALCTIHVWNAVTLELISTHERQGVIRFLVFSPDGEQIAVTDCVRVGTIYVVNLRTAAWVEEHVDLMTVHALTFSLNGTLHVFGSDITPVSKSGGGTTSIFRWIFGNPQKRRVKLEHSTDLKKVYSVSLNPLAHPKEIISVTDKHIYIWDFETSALLHKLPTYDGVHNAVMSRDNNKIILNRVSSLYIGDIESFEGWKKWEHRIDGLGIRVSPKRDLLLSWSQGDIRLYALPFGNHVLLDLPFSTVYPDPEFSPDGEHIFVPTVTEIQKIEIPQCYLAKTPLESEWISFSSDGSSHVFAHSKGGLSLHHHSSEKTIHLSFGEDSPQVIRCAKFSADATRLVGISIHGSVYLWDTSTRELLAASTGNIQGASSVSVSINEEIIVECTDKSCTRLTVGNSRDLVPIGQDNTDSSLMATRPVYSDFTGETDVRAHVFNDTAPHRRLDMVRWFSDRLMSQDGGFWAFINNRLVRGSRDGTYTVIPVDMSNLLDK